MISRDGHYEMMYAERPYDSGFRSVDIETEPENHEWERVPMFYGPLWFAVFQRPSKSAIRNSLDNGFTLTTKLFANDHIGQAVFNIDGNEYLPRHNKLKSFVTAAERDFTGHVIRFSVRLTPGVYRSPDLPYGTSLTFTTPDGKEWYIRLWAYATQNTSDPDQFDVVLDMDNLYTGFSMNDPARQKVPVTDLRRLSFNVVDSSFYAVGGFNQYGEVNEDLPKTPIKEPKLGDMVVSNITCINKYTGVQKTHARGRPQNLDGTPYQTDLGIATSFDDIANTNPRRVVEDMYKLGYRGLINHYMGISNYPRLKFMEDTQQFQLDPEVCLDEVVALWHEDFFQQCVRMNFKCIIAVSMEVFYDYVKWNWRHWMQLCQGFRVMEVDDEYIKIEGKHPWSATENPFLGGWEYQGLFNPKKEWAADIRFAHPEDGGVETTYKVLDVIEVPNENKTQLLLDKRFRGWYGDYSIGKPALTGYNPPSTFFGTCIEQEEGRSYVGRAFKELADLVPEGMERLFQVGEPWFWDGSYQNGRLFVYDEPTKRAALADGVEIPVWEDITTFTKQRATQQELNAANWLRDALGRYTQRAKEETQAVYPDAEFSALTFIPQIFTTKSEITPIINFPFHHWRYPNFEFFQYEAYDTIIWSDLEFTNSYCDYAFDKLGYPVEKTNYLGGFAPNKDPTGRVWRNIAHQLSWPNTKLDAANRPMPALIWASTQVNRDSVVFKNDGGALPKDKPIWDLVLEESQDWVEESRQDAFWLPSVYSVSEGTSFSQRKTAVDYRIDQWYLVNPEDPTEKVSHGNPIVSRRTRVIATQPAVGRGGSQTFYPVAELVHLVDQPATSVYPPGTDLEGRPDRHLQAVFDYSLDSEEDDDGNLFTTTSVDWGDGSAVQEGILEDMGDYADTGPEYPLFVEKDPVTGEDIIYEVEMDATYHRYLAGSYTMKIQPRDGAMYNTLWLRRCGVKDVDFGIFPIATEINLSYNDMTTVEMDALIDKLLHFSEERARAAYRRRVDCLLVLSQQSTGEHASPEKIQELVRFYDNMGVRLEVRS